MILVLAVGTIELSMCFCLAAGLPLTVVLLDLTQFAVNPFLAVNSLDLLMGFEHAVDLFLAVGLDVAMNSLLFCHCVSITRASFDLTRHQCVAYMP